MNASIDLKFTKKERKYLYLIIVIFFAACIETDIYLPAFTDMMKYFQTDEEGIQRILTWNFLGLCVSGIFYGPWSDSYGRKKPLLTALGLFSIGSVITVVARTFPLMLFGRVLQGLGSGGVFTLGTAIIFDSFPEKKSVIALNRINAIVPFIMAGAPILGGYLNFAYGFHANFLVIALCVLASLLLTLIFFEETLDVQNAPAFNITTILKNFGTLLRDIRFWQLTLTVSILFAGYITFLSGISVLYVIEFGVSKETFPLFQGAVLLGYLVASLSSGLAIEKLGIQKVKAIGTGCIVLGGAILLWVSLAAPRDPYLLTFSMIPYSFGFMWTQTPYLAELMDLYPEIKGIASSVVTSVRLLIVAAIVGITSSNYNSTIFPLTKSVLAVILVSLTAIVCYEKKRKAAISFSN